MAATGAIWPGDQCVSALAITFRSDLEGPDTSYELRVQHSHCAGEETEASRELPQVTEPGSEAESGTRSRLMPGDG